MRLSPPRFRHALHLWSAAVLLLAAVRPPTAAADTGSDPRLRSAPFVAAEGHASLLSDAVNQSIFNLTYGAAVRGGYQFDAWSPFAMLEVNVWQSVEIRGGQTHPVLDAGVGIAHLFGDGLVRSSVAAGVSILLRDTALDDAGSLGFFTELRPVGLRWAVSRHVVVGLDPLTFALVAPVLDSIPLVRVQYRTVLSLEGVLW